MVLDPLSALSVAGTVVQFVDFSCKILTKSHELYNSSHGQSAINQELDSITKELSRLSARLIQPLGDDADKRPLSEDEQALQDICEACGRVAGDIIARLRSLKIQGKHRAWQSVRQAIRSAWQKDEIEALVARLSRFKDIMELHIFLAMRGNIDLLKLRQSDQFKTLHEDTQSIFTAMVEGHTASVKAFEEQNVSICRIFERTTAIIEDEHEKTRSFMMRTMPSGVNPTGLMNRGNIPIPGLSATKFATDKVLDDLRFFTMGHRHEAVAQAHQRTFEWIFRESLDQPWSSFIGWLRSGQGIYWINGKAASGKSTLMRYIYDSAQTYQQLLLWAGDLSLTVAGFFFWNGGSVEQRSYSGLLRSLLHAVLKQHADLIPISLPERWARSQVEGAHPLNRLDTEPFTLMELMAAFKLLIEQTTIPLKLCFFIDGLDEYDGDYGTILELFHNIASFQNVKVCLSSRPLLIFEDAFSSVPGLRLQDLTRPDIECFVDDKLHNNPRFLRLAQDETERAPALTHEIVTKADGVFLWVALVVKSLLAGLGNRDGILDLQRRLRMLPSDLEALYKHMLMFRIEAFYLCQASQMFQIVRAAREIEEIETQNGGLGPLNVLDLSLAMEEDPNTAIATDFLSSTKQELATRCHLMEDRLKSRCAGLLEIEGLENLEVSPARRDKARIYGRVQYLHRTVKDYLEKPDIWPMLLEWTAAVEFNPNLALVRSCVLRLKLVEMEEPRLLGPMAMLYAHRADIQTGKGHMELINELDRTVTYRMNRWTTTDEHWGSHKFQDSIVSFAVQYGLHEYVSEILSRNSNLINKPGKPLLFSAVDPIPSNQLYPLQLSQKMVSILLAYGADPNAKFNGLSAWEVALRLPSFVGGIGFACEIAAIFQIFLQHGADPYAYVTTDKGPQPARTTVLDALRKSVPEESSRLDRCWNTSATLIRRKVIKDEPGHKNSEHEDDERKITLDCLSSTSDIKTTETSSKSKRGILSSFINSKSTGGGLGSAWNNISSLQIFKVWRQEQEKARDKVVIVPDNWDPEDNVEEEEGLTSRSAASLLSNCVDLRD